MKRQLLIILLLLYTAVFQSELITCQIPSFSFHDTSHIKKPEKPLKPEKLITISDLVNLPEDNYPVQLGAFKLKANAEALYRKIEMYMGDAVKIIKEDGYYKVRITNSANNKVSGYFSLIFSSETIRNNKKLISVNPDTDKIVSVSDTTEKRTAITGQAGNPPSFNKTQLAESAKKVKHRIILLNNSNPWFRELDYLGKSVALVNALTIIIITAIFTMIVLLIFILLNRTRMEKEEKLRQLLLEKYQEKLVGYLYGDNLPEEFIPIASDKFRRQVLIDQIIDISINLKGDTKAKLQDLYLNLELDKDSLNKVSSRPWHKKIKGFRELAFMNIRKANDEIYRCLESKNEILRIEAQIALVRLSDNPFEFLNHLERPFSLWEQITLHELLVQHDMQVPSFSSWLTSPNNTIVLFSLRMIREYKQVYSENEVLKVLHHSNPAVRKIAIEVTGDLEMKKALTIMKKMYKNENYENNLEILRSMSKMPDENMLGFLKLVLDKEDDVQLQIEATKAIKNMGLVGVRALVKIMESEYKNYNIIIRHVLDQRIN